MRNTPLSIVHATGAGPARIDGVDVGRLLRGLGEASATSSALDLFGLCLSAQRVLVQVQDGGMLAQGEAALLAAYRAMPDTQREIMLEYSRAMAGRGACPAMARATVHSLRPGGVR